MINPTQKDLVERLQWAVKEIDRLRAEVDYWHRQAAAKATDKT